MAGGKSNGYWISAGLYHLYLFLLYRNVHLTISEDTEVEKRPLIDWRQKLLSDRSRPFNMEFDYYAYFYKGYIILYLQYNTIQYKEGEPIEIVLNLFEYLFDRILYKTRISILSV